MINEELSIDYKNPHTLDEKESLLTKIGEILQFQYIRESGERNMKLVTWNRVEESNKFLLEMESYEDISESSSLYQKALSISKWYKINFVTREEVR